MEKKHIRFKIDKKGNISMQALEGFKGSSCMKETKQIELALGGQTVDSGKSKTYYDGDDPLSINIKL